MKILSNNKIDQIERHLNILNDFIQNSSEHEDKKRKAIAALNVICADLDIPRYFVFSRFINRPFLPDVILPPVRFCESQQHEHNFELLPIGENKQAILYCRHCAEVKRISLDKKKKKKKQEVE